MEMQDTLREQTFKVVQTSGKQSAWELCDCVNIKISSESICILRGKCKLKTQHRGLQSVWKHLRSLCETRAFSVDQLVGDFKMTPNVTHQKIGLQDNSVECTDFLNQSYFKAYMRIHNGEKFYELTQFSGDFTCSTVELCLFKCTP